MSVTVQGLTDNARKTSITELNACVADGIALSCALKQAHWNMKGRNFIAVHELFDQVKDRLDEHVDTMAERVQQLDGVAIGTVDEVAKTAGLKEYPTTLVKAEDHLKALCERFRDYGERLRAGIDVTDEAGDKDTADIFTGASRQVDKDLWFMASHLD